MKIKILLVAALTVAAGAFCETARAEGEIVQLPDGNQILRAKPSWGEAKNGLQLGVSIVSLNVDDQPYASGAVAYFSLILRNVGDEALEVPYSRFRWSAMPNVRDANGKPVMVGMGAQSGPPVEGSEILAPGAEFKVDRSRISIGPPEDKEHWYGDPVLNDTLGHYKVSFDFHSGRMRTKGLPEAKLWTGELKSGEVALEIAPVLTAPAIAERGVEFAAQLPPGAQLKAPVYGWGRELNGLQLGIQMQVPGELIPATKPVPLGTIVRFVLAVRNTGKTPRKIEVVSSMWSNSPRVTTEAGAPLSLHAQAQLFGAARGGQVFSVTKTLAPGEITEFEDNSLAIGRPATPWNDPVLAVAPGKYRVRYFHDFAPEFRSKPLLPNPDNLPFVNIKSDEDMNSAEMTIEVAPAQ